MHYIITGLALLWRVVDAFVLVVDFKPRTTWETRLREEHDYLCMVAVSTYCLRIPDSETGHGFSLFHALTRFPTSAPRRAALPGKIQRKCFDRSRI